MWGYMQLTQAELWQWLAQARPLTSHGQLPTYVPCLATVDPEVCAVCVQFNSQSAIEAGEIEHRLALMSLMKPFLLLFVLEQLGADAVFRHVGMRPSDQPFHSLTQLTADGAFPRNPMINSGAMVLADLLPGETAFQRCDSLRQWLNQQAGCQLQLDQRVLASVRSLPNESNQALGALLQKAGRIQQIERVLDTYNHLCCLSGTVQELGRLGLLLSSTASTIQQHTQRIVNALMLTCGLYEASGEIAVRIGLPIKSGVSGGLLAIMPRQGAIAIYSPAINAAGNSVAGLFLLEKIAQHLDLSVF
jgi:glutaminase